MEFSLHTDKGMKAFIHHHFTEGIRYWIPGDVREARHIIGWSAYKDVFEQRLTRQFGKAFRQLCISGELPVTFVGENSSGHYLYTLND